MKKRILLLATGVIALIICATPVPSMAGLSMAEVKINVENLWKTIKEGQPHITAVEFKKIMEADEEEFVLVDVRTAEEYNVGHLPSAIHIDRGLIEWVVPRTIQDTNTKIYTYCRTGARSAFVAQRLIEMGYTDVTNIYDAFKGWVVAGYPVFNRHGEFVLKPQAFERKDPYIGE